MGEREDVLAELRERARYYASLTEIGFAPRRPAVAAAGPARPARPAPAAGAPASDAPSGGGPPSDAALAAIRAEIGDCQRCKLAKGRKTIVFGQGSPAARLMFVGEAPGAEEDEQGLAFVGAAGQLLTKIIEAMGMRREDVFIVNILKCRPPQNRNPEPDEVLSCAPFLERQIDAVHPKVLVGLGKFAGQWLLKTADPISRIRGRLGEYNGIPVMPTYHPAYLLRTPSAKKDVWEDMKVVRGMLGLE